MTQFYAYLWLRETDFTPYYAGKGKGNRAFTTRNHIVKCPASMERIVVLLCDSERAAFQLEVHLIAYYGRKDLGTGCLWNFTNGGEGSCGWKPAEATRQLWSKQRKGLSPSDTARSKMSVARKGVPRSQETRNKISKSHMGLRCSGWKQTAESNEKRRQAHLRRAFCINQ